MTIWHTSNSVLRDFGQPTARSKTFAIPIEVTSLKINTIYNFYVNGINMNWACKPFGGVLGGNIVSDITGTVNFNLYYDQRHIQGFMANGSNNNILITSLKCELRDTSNNSTFFFIPIHLKPSQ